MRLLNDDVEDRLKVKRVKLDRKISENSAEIMAFGENNDYPNVIEKVVQSSVTAVAVRDIYARFLTGGGFENEALNNIVVAKDIRQKDVTLLDLLRMSAASVALNNGVWVKVKVNPAGLINHPEILPFKNCRFGKTDQTGYISHVHYYDKWPKDNGKSFTRDKDEQKVKKYPLFNLNENVLAAQMAAEGGPEKFPGQVYFQFWDNSYLYPLSPFDPVYLDADSEWQVSLFKNREIRNGFMASHLIRVQEPNSEEAAKKLKDKIMNLQGADGDRIVLLTDEIDPETNEIKATGAFKVDKVESNIRPNLFEQWEQSLSNRLRKANKAIPAVLLDYEQSKLGTTSGEGIIQAISFYNLMTKDDRSLMSRMFRELFSNSIIDQLRENDNWNIKELKQM